MEVVEQLRQRVKAYVAANNREWANAEIQIDKMEYQNAITLIIAMERTCLQLSSWFGSSLVTFMQIAQAGKTGEDAGVAGPSSCEISRLCLKSSMLSTQCPSNPSCSRAVAPSGNQVVVTTSH